MATFTKIQSFVEAMAEKKHDLGANQLKVALCAAGSPPLVTNTVLANLTPIAYTNLAGVNPLNLTTSSSAQTAGVYKLVVADLTLTISGGDFAAFQYVAVYNDDAANKELIAFFDYGAPVVLHDGDQFILDLSAANGLLQVA